MKKLKYRSIFISDVHLGTKDANAEFLLDFLQHTECDNLFLLGDIIDIWKVRSGLYWPQMHSKIIQIVFDKANAGTNVVYVPGNHDEQLRDYVGMNYHGVKIVEDHLHETADGKKLLLFHGDILDSVVISNGLINFIGVWSYDFCLWLNRQFNYFRRKFGFPYWSLAYYIKSRIKNAMLHIEKYMHASIREAVRHDVDGVICGHIHHAELTSLDGITYCNTGDWVENCTSVVEKTNGELCLVRWVEERDRLLFADLDDVDHLHKVTARRDAA